MKKKNYRPISKTCEIGKFTENILEEQLRNYLESHIKFPNKQHGFRKNHSTTTILNTLMEDPTKQNNLGKTPAMISLDLSSAFDLFQKEVLFHKLKNLEIGEGVISWIKSFLTDRTQ